MHPGLEFTTTRQAAQLHGVKMCVYGRAGVGKTHIVQTLPNPLLLSAEAGVLVLGHLDIPQITIRSFEDMDRAYRFVTQSEHARQFDSIALDSVSEIAEKCLSHEKSVNKDGRAAYGELNEKMAIMIRKWRDLSGFHVYFSAKQEAFTDDMTHVTKYGPSMPGRSLTGSMPYFFDELFCLEIGKTQEGQSFRYLRTAADLQYEAKDRSGALDAFEEPHLGKVIEKILARIHSLQSGAQ